MNCSIRLFSGEDKPQPPYTKFWVDMGSHFHTSVEHLIRTQEAKCMLCGGAPNIQDAMVLSEVRPTRRLMLYYFLCGSCGGKVADFVSGLRQALYRESRPEAKVQG
jgi:hypothetical protein